MYNNYDQGFLVFYRAQAALDHACFRLAISFQVLKESVFVVICGTTRTFVKKCSPIHVYNFSGTY